MPGRLSNLIWLVLVGVASITLAGCGDSGGSGGHLLDGSDADGSDVEFDFGRSDTSDTTNPDLCADKAICTQEGNRSCSTSPQGVLECRRDPDGCLVQTLVEACTNNTACDDTTDPPACLSACADVAPEDLCEDLAAGTRRCDGVTLQTCAQDPRGCWMFTQNLDCTTEPGANACVEDAAGAASCAFDPCVGADDCTPGRACTGASLLTMCEPDASGCLRETPYDCALVIPESICDNTVTPHVCLPPSVDPCEGVPEADRCSAQEILCADATTLSRCQPNAFGCLVRSVTDCNNLSTVPANAQGYCDATNPDAPRCAVDLGDRCADLALCDQALSVGGNCDASQAVLTTCALNPVGCLVQVDQETCTNSDPAFVCNEDLPGEGFCGFDCDHECEDANTMCANNSVMTCVTDADSDQCREWQAAINCSLTGEFCSVSGGSVACGAGLDEVEPNNSCADALANGDQGVPAVFFGNISSSTDQDYFSFTLTETKTLKLAITDDGGVNCPGDLVLFLYADSTCDSAIADDDDSGPGTCPLLDATMYPALVDLAPGTYFARVRPFSAYTGPYMLRITSPACGDGISENDEACDDANTADGDGCAADCSVVEPGFVCPPTGGACAAIICGDGRADGTETCDDANQADADGCSADCSTIEPGFICPTPGQPCIVPPAGDVCSNPLPIDADGIYSANTSTGNFSNDYSAYRGACRTSGTIGSAAADVVYSIELQPNEILTADVTNDTFDSVLSLASDCADIVNSCLVLGDDPDTITYTNTTPDPQTLLLVVDGYSAGQGAFDLVVTRRLPVCSDGIVDANEACDDANQADADGCSADCSTIEPGFICPTPGQPCVVPPPFDTCANPEPIGEGTILSSSAAVLGFTDDYTTYNSSDCGGFARTRSAPDRVFSVDIPPNGTLNASLDTGNAYDATLVVATDCADISGSCARIGTFSDNPQVVSYTNTSPTDTLSVFLIADGEDPADHGDFTLTVSFTLPVCGNGVREQGELCDDSNQIDGDGCSADCLVIDAGDTCDAPVFIGTDGTYAFNTSALTDDYGSYRGTCSVTGTHGAGAPDAVFALELQPSEILTAELINEAFDSTLVLSTDCADIVNTCADLGDDPDAIAYTNTTGGPQTVFLIADGYGTGEGAFDLQIQRRLPACGDGIVDTNEACDDANQADADGCSADCSVIEPGFICPTPGLPCVAGIAEIEPNDTCADASSNGPLTPPFDVFGSLASPNDIYAITLDTAATLTLEVTDIAGTDCPGDMLLDFYTTPACSTIAATDDDGGIYPCPLLDGAGPDTALMNLAPGTYFVRVRPFSGYADAYRLTATIQ